MKNVYVKCVSLVLFSVAASGVSAAPKVCAGEAAAFQVSMEAWQDAAADGYPQQVVFNLGQTAAATGATYKQCLANGGDAQQDTSVEGSTSK